MSRYIDADALNKIKFHPLPYTHIISSYVDAESYKRGWNDVVDAIIENVPTADVVERKKGKWIEYVNSHCECPFCHKEWSFFENMTEWFDFCPNCGADMR